MTKRSLLPASLFVLLSLLPWGATRSAVSSPANTEPFSLWLLSADEARRHGGEDGSLLSRIGDFGDAQDLVFDEERGTLWVLSAGELNARHASGAERFTVPFEGRSGVPGRVFLRREDGTVWVVAGGTATSFGEVGQRLVERPLPAPEVGAALSPDGERLWLATEEGVETWDAVSGEPLLRLDLETGPLTSENAPRALAVGPDGTVWLALGTEVAVFEPDGTLSERLLIAGIEIIDATSGGFWAVRTGGEVLRYERRDGVERSLSLSPFEGLPVERLAADPRGGVWVASGSQALRLDEAGKVLDALEASGGIRAFAWSGSPEVPVPAGFDDGWGTAAVGGGPRISVTAPARYLQINPADLEIELAFEPGGLPLDLSTLEVRLDGAEITATCQVLGTGALCAAGDPAEGLHRVSVSISDTSGQSAAAELRFWALVGEGRHELALPVAQDSFIRGILRNRNEGDSPFLQLRWAGRHRALAGFDLAPIASQVEELHSATLELWVELNAFNWGPSGRAVDLHRLTVPWTETGVTWNCPDDTNPADFRLDCLEPWNGGSFDPIPSASVPITSGQLGWVAFDVTADVAAAFASGEDFGWLVKKSHENRLGLIRFASREGDDPDLAPRLVLEFDGGEPVDPEPPVDPDLPPDPATVAPPLDRTVPHDVFTATEFLYTGDDPIQTGVAPGIIDPRRVAALRGQVFDRNGDPLPGVHLAVLDHPELGSTLSRADGWFDLVVNGGGRITLEYSKDGFLTVQRQVEAPWRDWKFAEDVVMLAYDPNASLIQSGAADAQVARGSAQTDADGTRQATLVFPAGTTAEMELADGTVQPLPAMTVRATEYTVGPSGPDAMPGPLPPTVAYTYAVELSADEAEAAGAVEVRFDRPVYLYVENFLGFPVGERVPLGYWDRRRAAWIGAPNGRVIEILGVDPTGLAEVDVDGSGVPADATALAELGFTDGERERLAQLYSPGTELWRSPIPHLTPWDCNFPYAPPPDAVLPPDDDEDFDLTSPEELEGPEDPSDPWGEEGDEGDEPDKDEDPCERDGSILECQDQVLGEALRIVGSELSLHYRSDRQSGRTAEYRLRTRVTTADPPASLEGVQVEVRIGGQRVTRTFEPTPNQVFSFTWDGRDGYDRESQGQVPVTIVKRYQYRGTFQSPADRAVSWGRFPRGSLNPIPRDRSDSRVTLTRTISGSIEDLSSRSLGTFDARDLGLGGWTLSSHHVYDPDSRTLYLGDGSQRRASWLGPVVTRLAGDGSGGDAGDGGAASRASLNGPSGVAMAPDGSVYLTDTFNHKVKRVDPQGVIRTFAGTGTSCAGDGDTGNDDLPLTGGSGAGEAPVCGDGGPALEAQLSSPEAVAVAGDGSILIADTGAGCVRRVRVSGIIETVAGQCRTSPPEPLGSFGDDGLPATAVLLDSPTDLVTAPDGGFYVADPGAGRVVHVGPGGLLATVAGGGDGAGDDGDRATAVALNAPSGVAIGPNGDLFVAETSGQRIRRVAVDGRIYTLAGTGVAGFSGDGGPATEARLADPRRLRVAADGAVYITDSFNGRIRKIDAEGILRTVAGGGSGDSLMEGGSAVGTPLREPLGLALTPGGELLIADLGANSVLRMGQSLEGFGRDELVVPAAGGGAVYVFDAQGRHLRTVHSLTGAELYRFEYDQSGLLSAVVDASAQRTVIERDGDGDPESIIAPSGQSTALVLDPEGYLENFVDPAGLRQQFLYRRGLIELHLDPRGNASSYDHGTFGRLQEATDRAGKTQNFRRHGVPFGPTRSVVAEDGSGSFLIYKSFEHRDGVTGRSVNDGSLRQHVMRRMPDGERRLQRADGSEGRLRETPDPRFGLGAKRPGLFTAILPEGLLFLASTSSRADLADPDDPLSLTSLDESVTVNGHTFSSFYSAFDRTFFLITPEGRFSTTRLDAQGRVVERTRPGFAPIRYDYRGDGLLSAMRVGDGPEARVMSFAYDALRRPQTVTDPLGRVSSLAYDASNRLIAQTRPDGSELGFSWDPGGNLVSLTRPGASAHGFEYTPRDQVSTYLPPGGGPGSRLVLSYRPDRQLERIERSGGEILSFAYDALGRLESLNHPRGTTTVAWDPVAGQVASLTTSGGTAPSDDTVTSYGYQGPLLRSLGWSGPVAGTVAWSFNSDFQVSSSSVNGALLASYGYDHDGLLVQAGALTLARDLSNGRVTGTSLGAVTTGRGYNDFGELTSHTAEHAGTPLYIATYQRDALGRITERAETILGTTRTTAYAYDLLGRLIQVERDGLVVEAYEYDGNGNRTSATGPTGTETASYDEQDRLLTLWDRSYTYTLGGELATKTQGGQTAVYDYDAMGNLRSVQLPGAPLIEYVVDGENRRIGKKVAGTLVRGWLYADVLSPVAELDGSGAVVSRFVYGSRGNVPSVLERDGRTYRIVADPLGSVRLVVDAATGEVAQRLDYDAFGRITLDTNPGFQPFGFAGGLYDHQTGLVRFGVRDYDPESGRWTTKDPLGLAGGDPNFYAYVGNDPVNLADPSGQILPALAVAWGAVEVGLTLYDLYDAYDTFTDPCADLWDKALSAGGVGLGGVLPGGGYGLGAKAGKRLVAEGTAKIGPKIERQLAPRGWTRELIEEALEFGDRVRATNKANGNPATRYIHPSSGQSVVLDDVTGDVIHVGGPGFKYGVGSGDLP